jgi:hypothetical protein
MIGTLLTLCLMAALLWLGLKIGSSVRTVAEEAMAQHAGDRVEALMAFVQSEDHTLQRRNRAVWALGQLGDPRALKLLESLRTGRPCDHHSELCQRELHKAIALCRGGTNVSAWIWRGSRASAR